MSWPILTPEHPLLTFHARLPDIIKEAGHTHIWGVEYLRSVNNDVDKAAAALTATLKWRKDFGLDQSKPEEVFGPDFDGLGYVTKVQKDGKEEVVTWNVYGAVKSLSVTFGDLQRFLRWRINLMEQAIKHLHLSNTTTAIPDLGEGVDPHRIAQVHLYEGVSFLRMDPHVKAASKATIEIMSAHYPELLSRKFFVGVPLIMSWMFTAMKMIISAETAKKFVVISYKENLAAELGESGDVPKACGGSAGGLEELEQKLRVSP